MSAQLHQQQQTCLEYLLELKAPSRLGVRDASLFNAHPGDEERASKWLGWATLASDPPYPIDKLKQHAEEIRSEGLDGVVLIGQGGSSQAAMTITELGELNGSSDVGFKTLDLLSPVYVNHVLGSFDPSRTLYLVSSKSGSTIEVLMLERVVWQYVCSHIGEAAAARRFVAITDPGDGRLEKLAKEKGYRLIIPTPADVGGRFSALSAFAMFPAALVGIDIVQVMANAAQAQRDCSQDDPNNRALKLACFLYEAYLQGRDKFSLILSPKSQVFGLWVEQLVAESLGKEGKGILPNIEVDASILAVPRADRSAVIYHIGDSEGFDESALIIDKSIPTISYAFATPEEAICRFIIWEYAIALLGVLLEVFPFDQPDVEITKKLVRQLLGQEPPDAGAAAGAAGAAGAAAEEAEDPYHKVGFDKGIVKSVRVSRALAQQASGNLDQILRELFASLQKGDYFSLNAFVPFRGFGRREALERMRNRVASRLGVVSCLEIGPRYLHSTGQFHKGGPNTGVFLVLSADEDNDINIPGEDFTLGTLAQTQAMGDFTALAARDRRAIYVHLRSNGSEELSSFADRVCAAISATTRP